jgi:hypothetical protein
VSHAAEILYFRGVNDTAEILFACSINDTAEIFDLFVTAISAVSVTPMKQFQLWRNDTAETISAVSVTTVK